MIYSLPISPEYVKHWGLWEAIREIIQNAYDQRDATQCEANIQYNATGKLFIETTKGHLQKSSLVLGITDKQNDEKMRGQFGEGYKLALLVLTRLGKRVIISNGDEVWIPIIEKSEEFDTEILKICIEPTTQVAGVTFEIDGISYDDWKMIEEKLHDSVEDEILWNAEGKVFVGGLYVNKFAGFKHGYSFTVMKLDRDRQTVSNFDLAYKTSQLWSNAWGIEKREEVEKMLEEEKEDVRYVESHAPATFYSNLTASFYSKHGEDAFPVSTKEEIVQATSVGKKWILVPKLLRDMLGKVMDLFIGSSESPVIRLKKLRKKLEWVLDSMDKKELDDIIKKLEVV